MSEVIISGLVTGALYAVAGLSLMTIYRVSRVLNFALGALGSAVAYIAMGLLGDGLPYGVVLLIALASGAAMSAIMGGIVVRLLSGRDPLSIAIATLGMLLVVQGVVGAHFGYQTVALRALSLGGGELRIGPIHLTNSQLVILGVAAAAAAVLAAVFQRTYLGLAMRATSSGPLTAQLVGVRVARTQVGAWVIAGALGAVAALLVTPLTYLSPTSFTTFLLTAFGAIVLGGFSNPLGIVVAAMLFGVGMDLLQTYVSDSLPNTFLLLTVGIGLIARPNGLFGHLEHEVPEPAIVVRSARRAHGLRAWRPWRRARVLVRALPSPPRRARGVSLAAGIMVAVVLVPLYVSGSYELLVATAFASAVTIFGLNALVGHSGQVSLGHGGFVAIGAYAGAIATTSAGLPLPVALVVAVVVSAIAGAIVGLPATRLSGLYLGVFTLVFGFASTEWFIQFGGLTGGAAGKLFTTPTWLATVNGQYWFVLGVMVVAGLATHLLLRSRVGRAWRAVRDSEAGAGAIGLNRTLVKLSAFTFSAGMAGLGGALGGILLEIVSPSGFDVFTSVYLVVAVMVGGRASVAGGVLGALFITLMPKYTSDLGITPDVAFGVVLLLVMIIAPDGILGAIRSAWSGLVSDTAEASDPLPPDASQFITPHRSFDDEREAVTLLELRGVFAGYGRGTVLQDIDLKIDQGEIVALIGANGVGKSTLLRAVSQVIPPARGQILWHGKPLADLVGHSVSGVARVGVAHVPEGRGIFPDLTVAENLRMAKFARPGHIAPESVAASLEGVLDQFPNLRGRLRQRAGTLSGGEQQMLAIGRALMSEPELLMLDEPSLGLSPLLRTQVLEAVRAIADGGRSVLLVEQNARAALAISDRAYVLSGGRIAMAGSAAEMLDSEDVARTYMALN